MGENRVKKFDTYLIHRKYYLYSQKGVKFALWCQIFKKGFIMDKEKIKALQDLLGRELRYKDICQELGLEPKGGKQKRYQLEDIQKYCELERIQGTQRYLVKQIYDDSITAFIEYLDAPDQQLLFDAMLYQTFLDNGCQPLYLSNTEMLMLFREVNENFLYTFNRQALNAINKNFVYMADMSKIVYRILHQWTYRRIENLDARHIVFRRYGFRLYKTYEVDGKQYTLRVNVKPDSEQEKRCQLVWTTAMHQVLGVNYLGSLDNPKWMPEAKWNQFEERVGELTKQEFADDGGYDKLRSISILSCPESSWLQESIDYILRTVGSPELINTEAKRKILGTTQLDTVCTNGQRQEFIQYNMTKNPPRWFKKDRASES